MSADPGEDEYQRGHSLTYRRYLMKHSSRARHLILKPTINSSFQFFFEALRIKFLLWSINEQRSKLILDRTRPVCVGRFNSIWLPLVDGKQPPRFDLHGTKAMIGAQKYVTSFFHLKKHNKNPITPRTILRNRRIQMKSSVQDSSVNCVFKET